MSTASNIPLQLAQYVQELRDRTLSQIHDIEDFLQTADRDKDRETRGAVTLGAMMAFHVQQDEAETQKAMWFVKQIIAPLGQDQDLLVLYKKPLFGSSSSVSKALEEALSNLHLRLHGLARIKQGLLALPEEAVLVAYNAEAIEKFENIWEEEFRQLISQEDGRRPQK